MTGRAIQGRRIGDVSPGSAAWLQFITASKVAAILGLSPWESRYSLYHRMNGTLPAEPETDEQARGHYLEGGVCDWLADRHPELTFKRCGMYVHRHRGWQAATPDRIAWHKGGKARAVEAKTDGSYGGEWGIELTDEIPPYYKVQAIWQLDVTGLDECIVGVLTGGLRMREYLVEYDEEDAAFMRTAALEFKADLEAGRSPDIDAHSATYQALRRMHPDIDDREIEIPSEQRDRYHASVHAAWDAELARDLEVARLAQAMGTAHYAKDETTGQRFAARAGNPPSVGPGGPRTQWKRRFIL